MRDNKPGGIAARILDLCQGLYLLNRILEEDKLHGLREGLLLGGVSIVGSDLLLEVEYKGMCGAIPGAISKPSGCEIGEEHIRCTYL